MLAIGIRYLTGYAVATDVRRGAPGRETAEWPPHPARAFMALSAAMFETGGAANERKALEWLEMQGPPALCVSDCDWREVVTHYVPPNDWEVSRTPARIRAKAVADAMNVLPTYRLKKQSRTYPRVRPLDDIVYLIWSDATASDAIVEAIDQLCQKVIRVGHSSSLVQMWVEPNPPQANWLPAEFGELSMRVVMDGTLDYLKQAYNGDAIDAYAELQDRMAFANGKQRKALKEEIQERFGGRAPVSNRPTISSWQPYQPVKERPSVVIPSGAFASRVLVLTIDEGFVLGLESSWQLLIALRDTILSTCDPTPEWISGHQPDGSPSQQPHLAMFPLAFVGRDYADGHLMGIALAFPKAIDRSERGRALRGLLYDRDGEPRQIQLQLGSLGEWTLTRELRPTPPLTLDARTWTQASDIWASVTPVVLDRHPKADRSTDRAQWTVEVAAAIAESCELQGLPRPIEIEIDKTSWHRGSPRAVGGKSSGFPVMPVKTGQPQRQQVHAWLRFAQPIEGPLLLGAGRYRGYGLFRPWRMG